jgi:hypothetical protein
MNLRLADGRLEIGVLLLLLLNPNVELRTLSEWGRSKLEIGG